MAKLFDDDELYFEEYKKNVQKECTDQAGYVRRGRGEKTNEEAGKEAAPVQAA